MPKFVRMLVATLLVVFAAGSFVHATSTTTMVVKMALADGGPMDMADCTGCDADGDEAGLTCDLVCIAPFVADLGTESTVSVPVAVATAEPRGVYDFVGRTGPPDPYPPRTLI